MYCVWNVFCWIFGFVCSNIDQFGFLEREVDNYSYVDYCCKIISKWCFVDCLVVLVCRLCVFEDIDNYQYVNDDKDNNCCDFDQ